MMSKYKVIDDFSLFEFHDSVVASVKIIGNDVICELTDLNIHHGNDFNPSEHDMKIVKTIMKFEGVNAACIKTDDICKKIGDENVKFKEGEFYHDNEAKNIFFALCSNSFIQILDCKVTDDHNVKFICARCFEGGFEVLLHYDSVIFEWDSYDGWAWYEYFHRYVKQLSISQNDEKTVVPIDMVIREDETGPQEVILTLNLFGVRYDGCGETPMEALENLSKKLPEDIQVIELADKWNNNMVDYIKAHKHCGNHRDKLKTDKICGCFYCLSIFSPDEIHQWLDNQQTALCPYCSIDSVIGESSGYPITKEFLEKMKKHWFSEDSN